jgi:RNA polymerase sigma factor (TIGR02999 family)
MNREEPEHGAGGAANTLLPLVYEQLREIAQQRLGGERRDHTLQATALVHEAYLRLATRKGVVFESRAHFYHAAAEAMRRILIDHARAVGRVKRRGAARREPLPLNVVDLALEVDPEEILTLDEAIRRLEEEVDETAEALGISPSTVDRDWAYARAWLRRAIGTR